MTEYIKKHYRLILMSVFAALVCFGYQAFNSNIRIDTEELINHPGSTLGWLTIGRFGLVLLKRMLGLGVHRTIKSGILMLLFFILGGNVLTYGCYYFSGKKDGKPYWIFTLLYMTSNIWSFQFYFSLQQAEVAFAMLLMAVTGFFMCDLCFCEKYKENRSGKDLCKLFLSTVFIVLALGTYQALAVYYIAVCVMFFLLFFWQVNGKREKCGIRIIFLVAHFGISYLIYRGIAGTWFMAAGDYMEGQSNWGSEPAAECVKNVLRVVKNQLLTVGPRNFSFYVIGVLLAFYVIWIAWTRRTESGRAGFWIFAAGMIFMLITPFLMTIYAGAMLVTRTQFALPVVAAFLAMFGVMILKEQQISDVRPEKQERDRKMCRWLQVMGNVVILLVIAVTGGQVCYNIRMHSADQVRYEQDALLADQITDALKREIPGVDAEGDPVDKKVVFIGYRQPQLNSWNHRTEMYGWSFFEWDYTREHPAGATHRIAGFLEAHNGVHLDDGYSEEMEYKAAALSEDMTVFPAEGSIVEEKDLVVVKLSEITERPAVDWW